MDEQERWYGPKEEHAASDNGGSRASASGREEASLLLLVFPAGTERQKIDQEPRQRDEEWKLDTSEGGVSVSRGGKERCVWTGELLNTRPMRPLRNFQRMGVQGPLQFARAPHRESPWCHMSFVVAPPLDTSPDCS